MATVETKPITAEEYLKMPDLRKPTELIRGEIREMNLPTPRHGQICGEAYYLIRRFLDEHPTGHVVCNDSGVLTERDPDTVRGPDVAYYSHERIPPGPIRAGYLDVVPELVFEIRSATDRWAEIHIKVGEYLRAGVSVVCVLDDQAQTAHLYHQEEPPLTLNAEEELTFPGILEGFSVTVQRFFE